MSDGEFQIASTSIEPGVTFLEASAGTGKTYTISKIVVRLIAEQHIPISGILVMTFTEAATKELKTRIRSAIQQTLQGMSQADTSDELAILYTKTNPQAANSLRTALATFDEAAIFTIHGFCNRVLKEFAFESNRATLCLIPARILDYNERPTLFSPTCLELNPFRNVRTLFLLLSLFIPLFCFMRLITYSLFVR